MRRILPENNGKTLQIGGITGTIRRSMEITGDFPRGEDIAVEFDFVGAGAEALVLLTRRQPRQKERTGHWNLAAIENRDAKGLAGFVEFAKTLGISGAQLANIVVGLKPAD